MPVTPTYPGVYVQEIASGVRTITGVATAITAFIGRALRGPTDTPVMINSYADFERTFGGLWVESSLGYAVRDFYLNGGSQAIIVRLHRPTPATAPSTTRGASRAATAAAAPPADKARLAVDTLKLEAASAGAWGNNLRARVDGNIKPADDALFNLAIKDDSTGQVEYFRNLSVNPNHSRRVDRVLLHESTLVRVAEKLPEQRPKDSKTPAAGEQMWGDYEKPTNSKVGDEKGSDGAPLTADELIGAGKEGAKQGLYTLEQADLFNLLCIPPYTDNGAVDTTVITAAAAYCEKRRAMLLLDGPWSKKEEATSGIETVGTTSKNAAIFFPRLRQPNPLRENQIEDFSACGAVAGVFARTDAQRGIWKAPAGLDATLVGVPQLSVALTDAENGELNPLGINCLRSLPAVGRVIWGARTLEGDDRRASEWKYIPVRRLALYIEESLYRGTQWVVFEPNDEPLWAQIRLNLGAFMHNLFRQGAFQGKSPREAYFVKCDGETTKQTDINQGVVNIVVGFAPLKPAEFVIISLQQMAGQIEA